MAEGEGRRRFLIEIMGDTDQAIEALGRVVDKLHELRDASEAATRDTTKNLGELTEATRETGRTAEIASSSFIESAATVAAGALLMKQAMDATLFSAANLQEQIERVNDVIDRTGASTTEAAARFLEMGRPAGEMIGAMGELAKISGVAGGQLEGLAEQAFGFGMVTGQSTEAASRTITQFAQALNTTPENVDSLVSSLLVLSEKTGVSTQEMSRFVNILGGAARRAKLSEPAILGLSAQLGQMGVAGRRAIPGMTQLFTLMGKEPGKIARTLGMTVEQFKALAPEEAFVRLLESIKGAGKDAPKIMERLGIKSESLQDSLLNVANRATEIRDKMGLANAGFNDTSLGATEIAEAMGVLNNQMRMLGQSIEALFTRVGAFLVPIFTVFVRLMRLVVDVISLIPTPILGLVGGVLGLVAGFVLLVAVGLKFYNMMKSLLLPALNLLLPAFMAEIAAANALGISTWWVIAAKLRLGTVMHDVTTGAKVLVFWGWKQVLVNWGLVTSIQAETLSRGELLVATLMTIWSKIRETAVTVWNTVARWANVAAGWAQTAMLWAQTSGLAFLSMAYAFLTGGILAATSATWAFTVAILANPIGLIVAAVIALVAAVVAALVFIPKLFGMFDKGSVAVKAFAVALMVAFWPFVVLFLALKVAFTVIKTVAVTTFEVIRDAVMGVIEPFVVLFNMLGKIFSSTGEGISLMGMLASVLKGVAAVVGFLVKVVLLPFVWILKQVSFAVRVLIAIFGFVIDILVDFFQPVIQAFTDAWVAVKQAMDTVFQVFESIGELFGSTGESAGFMTFVLNVLKGVLQGLAATIGFVLKVVLFPLKLALLAIAKIVQFVGSVFSFVFDAIAVAVSVVTSPLRFLAWVFESLGNAISTVISIVTFGMFGSSMFHIAEGVAVILSPLQMLADIFGVIGKVIEFVSKIVTAFFSLFGGGGGMVTMNVGLALGNFFTAIAGIGDATVKGAVTGMGTAQVVEQGGGGGGAAAQDFFGFGRKQAQPKMASPRITIISQLVMDGKILAEAVQEHQAVEMLRLFNSPTNALRGMGEA